MAWADAMDQLSDGSWFAEPWTAQAPAVTPRGLADPTLALRALQQVSRKLQLQYGKLDVPYGQVARLRRAGHDYPASAGPVRYGVYSAAELGPARGGKAEVWGGDTFIAAIEFSQPLRAQGLLTYGNASQPGSRFIGDQLELFSRRELRPLWTQRPDVEQHLDHASTLSTESY